MQSAMSQQDLQPRGLYILLFARGDNADAKDDFHWALYLHQDKSNGGRKFHITGSAGKWLAEHGVTKGWSIPQISKSHCWTDAPS